MIEYERCILSISNTKNYLISYIFRKIWWNCLGQALSGHPIYSHSFLSHRCRGIMASYAYKSSWLPMTWTRCLNDVLWMWWCLQSDRRLKVSVTICSLSKHGHAQNNWVDQWTIWHIFDYVRNSRLLQLLADCTDQFWVSIRQARTAPRQSRVSLTGRASPYKVESLGNRLRMDQKGIHLYELVSTISGLGVNVHASYMKPDLLQPFSCSSLFTEKIQRPQLSRHLGKCSQSTFRTTSSFSLTWPNFNPMPTFKCLAKKTTVSRPLYDLMWIPFPHKNRPYNFLQWSLLQHQIILPEAS